MFLWFQFVPTISPIHLGYILVCELFMKTFIKFHKKLHTHALWLRPIFFSKVLVNFPSYFYVVKL